MMNTRLVSPAHEEIVARAQRLWDLAGNPAGRDLEFWQAAEAELEHERGEAGRTAMMARRDSAPSLAVFAQAPDARSPILPSAPRALCGFRPYETYRARWSHAS
jgi:hypothetical protein